MKTPGQGKKFIFRRIVAALALALSLAASSSAVQSAAGEACGWQTGCAAHVVVCLDKGSGKEIACPPTADTVYIHGAKDPLGGEADGWQTGIPNGD
jgi:hypothetical protein